jgi:hypothetical protein
MDIPILSRFGTAWRDLCAFVSEGGRIKYLFAAISIAITAGVMAMFYIDSNNIPYPERITYIQNWPANRSDAQIKADQKRDAALKKQMQAAKQAAYKRLADDLGIK